MNGCRAAPPASCCFTRAAMPATRSRPKSGDRPARSRWSSCALTAAPACPRPSANAAWNPSSGCRDKHNAKEAWASGWRWFGRSRSATAAACAACHAALRRQLATRQPPVSRPDTSCRRSCVRAAVGWTRQAALERCARFPSRCLPQTARSRCSRWRWHAAGGRAGWRCSTSARS